MFVNSKRTFAPASMNLKVKGFSILPLMVMVFFLRECGQAAFKHRSFNTGNARATRGLFGGPPGVEGDFSKGRLRSLYHLEEMPSVRYHTYDILPASH